MGQHHDGCLSSEVITVTTKGRLSLKPTNWWVKLNESSELSQATAASGVSSPPTWSTKRAKRPFSSIDVAVATLTLEIPGRHHGQRGSLPPPQKTYFHLIIPEWEVMKQGGPQVWLVFRLTSPHENQIIDTNFAVCSKHVRQALLRRQRRTLTTTHQILLC